VGSTPIHSRVVILILVLDSINLLTIDVIQIWFLACGEMNIQHEPVHQLSSILYLDLDGFRELWFNDLICNQQPADYDVYYQPPPTWYIRNIPAVLLI